ncbi:MAG: hypothetical protein ABGW78_11930 [Pirellulales bacterium]
MLVQPAVGRLDPSHGAPAVQVGVPIFYAPYAACFDCHAAILIAFPIRTAMRCVIVIELVVS